MSSPLDRDTCKLIIAVMIVSVAAGTFAGVGAAVESDFPTRARIGIPILMALALCLCAVYLYKAVRGLRRTGDRER